MSLETAKSYINYFKSSQAPLVEVDFQSCNFESKEAKEILLGFITKQFAEKREQSYWGKSSFLYKNKHNTALLDLHPKTQTSMALSGMKMTKDLTMFNDMSTLRELKIRQHTYAYKHLCELWDKEMISD